MLGVVPHTCNPALRSLRQEDSEFVAYICGIHNKTLPKSVKKKILDTKSIWCFPKYVTAPALVSQGDDTLGDVLGEVLVNPKRLMI